MRTWPNLAAWGTALCCAHVLTAAPWEGVYYQAGKAGSV